MWFGRCYDAISFPVLLRNEFYVLSNMNSWFPLRNEILEVTKALNNSRLEDDALIFNRVPKAGSEMMWALIDQLQVWLLIPRNVINVKFSSFLYSFSIGTTLPATPTTRSWNWREDTRPRTWETKELRKTRPKFGSKTWTDLIHMSSTSIF